MDALSWHVAPKVLAFGWYGDLQQMQPSKYKISMKIADNKLPVVSHMKALLQIQEASPTK